MSGQATAAALGADVTPTYDDPAPLVDEWLAADIALSETSPADSMRDDWLSVMFPLRGERR